MKKATILYKRCRILTSRDIQDSDIFLASGLFTKHADGFRGIAQNTVVKGQTLIVRQEGIDRHLTGLTAFADYQLSDTPGAIQTGTSATSDKVIGKLEKELGITLFENVEKVPSYATDSHSGSGLTLGDFIKKEDK